MKQEANDKNELRHNLHQQPEAVNASVMKFSRVFQDEEGIDTERISLFLSRFSFGDYI